MTTSTDTVKERALAALATALTAMQSTAPVDDPYGVQFSEVYREPPKELTSGKIAVAVVMDQNEVKKEKSFPVVSCFLATFVEVHVFRQAGQNSSERVNAHLGAVERMLRADRTLGGKTYEISFTGTEVTTQGPYDSYAAGVLKLELEYRHHTDDPRRDV